MQICGKSQRTGEETQTSLRGFKPMTFPLWGDSAYHCYACLWSILRLIKLKHKAAKDAVVSVQKINVIHSCSSLAMLKLLVFTSKCWLNTFSDPPGRLEQLESRMEQTKARQSSFRRFIGGSISWLPAAGYLPKVTPLWFSSVMRMKSPDLHRSSHSHQAPLLGEGSVGGPHSQTSCFSKSKDGRICCFVLNRGFCLATLHVSHVSPDDEERSTDPSVSCLSSSMFFWLFG